jgi:hypothetical protein
MTPAQKQAMRALKAAQTVEQFENASHALRLAMRADPAEWHSPETDAIGRVAVECEQAHERARALVASADAEVGRLARELAAATERAYRAEQARLGIADVDTTSEDCAPDSDAAETSVYCWSAAREYLAGKRPRMLDVTDEWDTPDECSECDGDGYTVRGDEETPCAPCAAESARDRGEYLAGVES